MKFNVQNYLQELEELVNTESHSSMPNGAKKVAEYLNTRLQKLGWHTEFIDIGDPAGPCLKATNKLSDHYNVLLVGHMDTVFPAGTVAKRPFSIDGDYFKGPGSADMKAGDLFMYHLADELTAEKALGKGNICLLFNPDEEIGSIYSRPIIEQEAKKSDYVLIMESARANGDLVNERKGIAKYVVDFKGIAAHAGVNPQDGASAINEFIAWGKEIIALNKPEVGTTVNIGLVSGGTGANVVAEETRCVIDVRVKSVEEAERVDKKMRELEQCTFDKRVKAKVEGGLNRPPLNPSPKSLELCALVSKKAQELNMTPKWVATGGGSDGNFTGALGIPTIDGMGPVGGGGHSDREYGLISSIEPRFKLLLAVVKELLK